MRVSTISAFAPTSPAVAVLQSTIRTIDTISQSGLSEIYAMADMALKLMETLQIPACAYELEEFLHGPELHLTPNHTLFFLASDPHDRARGAQLSRAASLVTSWLSTCGRSELPPHTVLAQTPCLCQPFIAPRQLDPS